MSTPMNRASRRRYKKAHGRSVWVFSDLNRDLRPEQIAKILTSAGLEQARREAEAQAAAAEAKLADTTGDQEAGNA